MLNLAYALALSLTTFAALPPVEEEASYQRSAPAAAEFLGLESAELRDMATALEARTGKPVNLADLEGIERQAAQAALGLRQASRSAGPLDFVRSLFPPVQRTLLCSSVEVGHSAVAGSLSFALPCVDPQGNFYFVGSMGLGLGASASVQAFVIQLRGTETPRVLRESEPSIASRYRGLKATVIPFLAGAGVKVGVMNEQDSEDGKLLLLGGALGIGAFVGYDVLVVGRL